VSVAQRTDTFFVLNGPEDGTQFSILRGPFHIGSDPSCTVHVALDTAVAPRHALVTAVGGGYRVRKVGSGALFVDDKRVGTVVSRVVRSGGTVQVGDTLLCVECVPHGLAGRSQGLGTENDLVWAARKAVGGLATGITGVGRFVSRAVRRILTSWKLLTAVVLLFLLLSPWTRPWAWYCLQWVVYYVRLAYHEIRY